ncbi:MAG: hypothetical protein ACF8Q5_07380 [Phycisphaerales bacterium JB040]
MLLIDAYNVLRAQWCLPRRHRGFTIRSLVATLPRTRYADRRVRVVADGTPGPEFPASCRTFTREGQAWARLHHPGRPGSPTQPPAEVLWSGRHLEADDLIEDILARSRGIEITLVSSDRRLIRAAASAGASQVGNGTFLKQLASDLDKGEPDPEPPFVHDVPLDPYAIAHWMHEFGYAPTKRPGGPRPDRAPPEPAPDSTEQVSSVGSAPDRATEGVTVPEPPLATEPLDPVLAGLFDEWSDRIDPADLDMSRWIDGVTPLPGPPGRESGLS